MAMSPREKQIRKELRTRDRQVAKELRPWIRNYGAMHDDKLLDVLWQLDRDWTDAYGRVIAHKRAGVTNEEAITANRDACRKIAEERGLV